MKRNGYIDVIKFFSALLVAEFHLDTGLFPGGRAAVEIFFMISAYLMMCTIERENSTESIAASTVRFIWRKYKALFVFLLPAVLLSFTVNCIYKQELFKTALEKSTLLIFDIIPLYSTGMKGEYVVGVSWYLSSMFISLAVLYPLCKKFRRGFTLLFCPLIALLGYGVLSNYYGSLAVLTQYLPETPIKTALIRGIACMALGCLLYEASRPIMHKKPTRTARWLFTLLEFTCFGYFLYEIHHLARSKYDYVLLFAIFVFLWIGINGLSFTSYLWHPKFTRPLGTASTIIVLCHSCWVRYFESKLGEGFQHTSAVWHFVLALALSSILVYACSMLLKLLLSRLSRLTLWDGAESTADKKGDPS